MEVAAGLSLGLGLVPVVISAVTSCADCGAERENWRGLVKETGRGRALCRCLVARRRHRWQIIV